MKQHLGIDLGGTSAKIALVGPNHKILLEGSVSSHGFPRPDNLVKKIGEAVRLMLRGRKVAKVGVGVAGDIDFARGVIRVSPNLGWKNVPLKDMVEKELKMKAIVDNDANVAGWGLYKTQAPKHVRNIIAVTLGTGVGGGIILNGQVYRGATGSAGEIGHMTMNEHGRLCNCGNYGCLETYAGGTHIVRTVIEALEKGQKSRLEKLFRQDPEQITPRSIADAAQEGDLFALSIWQQVGHVLGIALGNLIYVFNPEMIFFTGGVSQAKQLILKPMWQTLKKRTFKTPINIVDLVVAKNPANIGVIGAALL